MIARDILEWFIPSLKQQAATKGDVEGHEFHGNQYSSGSGSSGGSDSGGESSGGNGGRSSGGGASHAAENHAAKLGFTKTVNRRGDPVFKKSKGARSVIVAKVGNVWQATGFRGSQLMVQQHEQTSEDALNAADYFVSRAKD